MQFEQEFDFLKNRNLKYNFINYKEIAMNVNVMLKRKNTL